MCVGHKKIIYVRKKNIQSFLLFKTLDNICVQIWVQMGACDEVFY